MTKGIFRQIYFWLIISTSKNTYKFVDSKILKYIVCVCVCVCVYVYVYVCVKVA